MEKQFRPFASTGLCANGSESSELFWMFQNVSWKFWIHDEITENMVKISRTAGTQDSWNP